MKTIRKSALNSLVVVLLVMFPSQVLASELLERIRAQATQTSGEIRAEVQRIADSAVAKSAAEVRLKPQSPNMRVMEAFVLSAVSAGASTRK